MLSGSHSRGLRQRPPVRGAKHAYSPSSPNTDLAIEQKFDRETGLVYSEVEVRPNRNKSSDWIRDFNTPRIVTKPAPNAKGARPLADIARWKVVKEFRNLTSEHFATVPWTVAEKIWDQIVAMRAETFHSWRTLAAVYPDPEEFGQRQYRYFIRLKQPSLPLADYYKGITSPEIKWLTCLRVSPKQLGKQDLVSIHTIVNLAVLDLSDAGNEYGEIWSSFDERLMLSWAQLAASGQAFQHLRVLMFGWQEGLGQWIFKYTDRFPSLCHIIVTDCPNMHQRNRSDWEMKSQPAGWEARHAKRSAKSLRPIIKSDDFQLGSVSGCYYESHELFTHLSHSERPDLTQLLPVLEIWLGSPRQWTHIIEDFPGHRTIFFDNVKTQDQDGTKGTRVSSNREQTKRVRSQEQTAPGTTSPPPKRGPQARPAMRSMGKNLTDVLQEFNA